MTLLFNCSLLEADPRLTDYDTLLDNLRGLKEGKPVQVPIYDFKTSSRTGYRLVASYFFKVKSKFFIYSHNTFSLFMN